jgi:formylglycine-generating enzyme required for sulfatase activity
MIYFAAFKVCSYKGMVMTKRKILLPLAVSALLMLLIPAGISGEAKVITAVMPLEVAIGVKQSVAVPLTDRFRQELINSGRFMIVTRQEMDKVLREHRVILSDCTGECPVKVGNILGAEKLITGRISKLGKKYLISASIIDVETGTVERSETAECECRVEDLTGMMPTLAAKVAGVYQTRIADVTFDQLVLPEGRGSSSVAAPAPTFTPFQMKGGASLVVEEVVDRALGAEKKNKDATEILDAWKKVAKITRENPFLNQAQSRISELKIYIERRKIERHAQAKAERKRRKALNIAKRQGATDWNKVARRWKMRNLYEKKQRIEIVIAFLDHYKRLIELKEKIHGEIPGNMLNGLPPAASKQVMSFVSNERSLLVLTGLVPMVKILAGTFVMGSPASETGRDPDENQHSVTISQSFWIGETEVTQEQWSELMGYNPSYFKNCGNNCPVENISWYDVAKFCNRLSEQEGLTKCYSGKGDMITWDKSCNGYRLPTEAEWEYASKAGGGRKYPWGDDDPGDYCELLNYDPIGIDNCPPHAPKPVGIHPKGESLFGLQDMSGNVREWTWDWFGLYINGFVVNLQAPSISEGKVIRGGSWDDHSECCRSAYRDSYSPGSISNGIGFRVARTAD